LSSAKRPSPQLERMIIRPPTTMLSSFPSQSASHLHVKGDRVGQVTIHGGILGSGLRK
jgi:hypothetical protein